MFLDTKFFQRINHDFSIFSFLIWKVENCCALLFLKIKHRRNTFHYYFECLQCCISFFMLKLFSWTWNFEKQNNKDITQKIRSGIVALKPQILDQVPKLCQFESKRKKWTDKKYKKNRIKSWYIYVVATKHILERNIK